MARKSLEKQIAELKFDAKIYAAKQRKLALAGHSLLQTMSPDAFNALRYVSEGFEMLGLSIDEGLQLATRNRLPRDLQNHYRQMHPVATKDDDDADTFRPLPPVEDQYPRWKLDTWSCSCGEKKTLWHKTHFTFHDRNQIYCATCRSLAGWGSDRDFKAAKHKGEASHIAITHPLDIEVFSPPLMMPSKPQDKGNSIRAKRSQNRKLTQ